jgi:hypothetical protein
VVLSDKTRCDCVTDTHAIEFDFGSNWVEAVGQGLHYSAITKKKAGIVFFHAPCALSLVPLLIK